MRYGMAVQFAFSSGKYMLIAACGNRLLLELKRGTHRGGRGRKSLCGPHSMMVWVVGDTVNRRHRAVFNANGFVARTFTTGAKAMVVGMMRPVDDGC